MAKLKITTLQMWDMLKGLQNGAENILKENITAELEADSFYGILAILLNNYRSGVLTTETIQTLQNTLDEMKKSERSK